MKKVMFKGILVVLFVGGCVMGPSKPLMLDDFEGKINEETVDFGSGSGSEVKVVADEEVVNTGEQSLKISYKAVPSGYMWVARGYELDVKGADKWLRPPQDIRWESYGGFSFHIYSEKKGVMIVFDVKDKNKEMWRKVFTLKKKGWQKIEVPFDKLFARTDWQPEKATLNGELDYPIKSYQFEIRTPGEGVLYVDTVKLFVSKDSF